jgi:hypothetical protein
MRGFLRRLLGAASGPRRTAPAATTVEYEGYTITAAPEKDASGWRLAGTIARETGAHREVHHLVRADISPDRAAIVVMTIDKAKRLIDQYGDRLFRRG